MRRTREPHHDGDGYFVPMADMMAGIVFLFLVMLMTLSIYNIEGKDNEQTDHTLDGEVERQKQIMMIMAERKVFLENLARDLRGNGLQVEVLPAAGRLRLPMAQFYGTGEIVAGSQGRGRLAIVADALQRHLSCHGADLCLSSAPGRMQQLLLQAVSPAIEAQAASVSAGAFAAARTLDAYSTLISRQPALYELRNDAGQPLIAASGQVAKVSALEGAWATDAALILVVTMMLPPPAADAVPVALKP